MVLTGYFGKYDEFRKWVKYAEINFKNPLLFFRISLCAYFNTINISEKETLYFPSYQNNSLWAFQEQVLEKCIQSLITFSVLFILKSWIVDALGVGFCLFFLISEPYCCITYQPWGHQGLPVPCAAQTDGTAPLWRMTILSSWESMGVLSPIAASQRSSPEQANGQKIQERTNITQVH